MKNENSPYLIAEIGMNHEGSIAIAMEMVEQVAAAGWDAAKFQTYEAATLAAKDHSPSYWDLTKEAETSQFNLFSRLSKLEPDDYEALANRCGELGIDFLSTPFDNDSLQMLHHLMPAIKIASADLTNIPHLRQCAKYGKPILLSCGAGDDGEIIRAFETLTSAGAREIIPMHCILNYPTADGDAHLWRVSHLSTMFPGVPIGYSDHTVFSPGSVSAMAGAALLGATVFEKHFTFDKTLPGNDHYHSADARDLEELRNQITSVINMRGVTGTDFLTHQATARENARRRIFTREAIPQGGVFSENNLIPLRANVGLPVSMWDEVIGSRALRNLAVSTPVEFDDKS